MAKAKKRKQLEELPHRWYNETGWAFTLVPACLLGAYVMASLALNSASLLEYFVAIALLCLAVNRAAHLVIMGFHAIRRSMNGEGSAKA